MSNYRNSYKAALAIEEYALSKQNLPFLQRHKEKEKKWLLTLADGSTEEIVPGSNSHVVDYTFEHYYPSLKLIVFRAQWYEGNNYLLVSRKDGSKTSAYGPPVPSPSKDYLLSYNGQEVSSYSNNGLQLFEISGNGLTKIIEYDMELVPSRCKWINEHKFYLEVYKFAIKKGVERNYQHYVATINKTNS